MNFLKRADSSLYSVALYIRLSREDDDKSLESESIINQKSLLFQYAKENNLRIYDTYIDDGYSGTTFDRPAFKRLLHDIELGSINMVITKDMSRLGRDYIGVGNLLEKYFPEHNVRYIAVTDTIDTFLDSANNDIAPFKAIMNDMYAKDISKKIKSSLRAKQKEGKWVGGRAPFGYDIDSSNKNRLVINEEQAIVVRKIFDMCLKGISVYNIAKRLTDEGIKTPAQYYNFVWKSNYNLKYGQWHAKTIRDILTNRMYIGDMVQGKRYKVNYKIKKVVRNHPANYIIVENTHEAIISKDLFYEVQNKIPKNVGRNDKKEKHLLDGLLYCYECGHRISITSRRKKDNRCYTICNYYRTYMRQGLCTTHSNNYDILEQIIVQAVKNECIRYIDTIKIIDAINSNNLKNDSSCPLQQQIDGLEAEITKLTLCLDDSYLDKLNGLIDDSQYGRIKEKIEEKIKVKQDKITRVMKQLQNIYRNFLSEKQLNEYIENFISLKIFNRELIVSLIDKIELHQDKTVDIYFTFTNT